MAQYTKEDYARRIASASPLGLVIITYELALDYLARARETRNDDRQYRQYMQKAHRFFKELPASLNFAIDLSRELMSVYLYVNKLLATAMNMPDMTALEEAESILTKFKESFCAIAHEEADHSPSMENAAKVFAGLTYNHRGQLGEYVDDGGSRGYRA